MPASQAPADLDLRALHRRWARLIRRIYDVDPIACPRFGATMRIVAFISEPKVLGTILAHLTVKEADGRTSPSSPQCHPTAA